ncbi:MAG: hypothetical protein ACLQIB_43635 [Isosphaeraceae bacterium]
MTIDMLVPAQPVFEFSRPLLFTDAGFVPRVYQQKGEALDDLRLLAALTSFQPLTVAAPKAQGKGTLVSFLEVLVGRHPVARWLRFHARDATCPTASALLARLADHLECPPRPITLAEALAGSRVLAQLRQDGLTSVLLLDLASCHAPDVTEWLMASIIDINRELDLLAMRIQILLVTGHSQLDPSRAPHLSDGTTEITIANFTAAQSAELLRKGAYGIPAIEFDETARGAVFLHARGDKYFTHFLAAFCGRVAQGFASMADRLVVKEPVVHSAAGLIAGGMAGDSQILPDFVRAVAERRQVADALDMLCQRQGDGGREGTGEAWAELLPRQRAALEELGVIGAEWEHPHHPRPTAWRKPGVRTLRNPMVAELARFLLANRRSHETVFLEEPPRRPDVKIEPPRQDSSAPDVTIGPIDDLRVGDTEYVFRPPLTALYSPALKLLKVPGREVLPTGHGDSAAEALRDWASRFHLQYQKIACKPTSEMSRRDKRAIRAIQTLFDMPLMERERMFTIRQIGMIKRVNDAGVTFTWEDKERDTVPLDRLPAECLSYPPGQRVEAIVQRLESSFEVVRVLHTQSLPPLRRLTDREADELWESLPGSSTRPADSWD